MSLVSSPDLLFEPGDCTLNSLFPSLNTENENGNSFEDTFYPSLHSSPSLASFEGDLRDRLSDYLNPAVWAHDGEPSSIAHDQKTAYKNSPQQPWREGLWCMNERESPKLIVEKTRRINTSRTSPASHPSSLHDGSSGLPTTNLRSDRLPSLEHDTTFFFTPLHIQLPNSKCDGGTEQWQKDFQNLHLKHAQEEKTNHRSLTRNTALPQTAGYVNHAAIAGQAAIGIAITSDECLFQMPSHASHAPLVDPRLIGMGDLAHPSSAPVFYDNHKQYHPSNRNSKSAGSSSKSHDSQSASSDEPTHESARFPRTDGHTISPRHGKEYFHRRYGHSVSNAPPVSPYPFWREDLNSLNYGLGLHYPDPLHSGYLQSPVVGLPYPADYYASPARYRYPGHVDVYPAHNPSFFTSQSALTELHHHHGERFDSSLIREPMHYPSSSPPSPTTRGEMSSHSGSAVSRVDRPQPRRRSMHARGVSKDADYNESRSRSRSQSQARSRSRARSASRPRVAKSAQVKTPHASNSNCGGGDFVNFTLQDSEKLLGDVAPSGSSKTRARREAEEKQKRKKIGEVALKAIRNGDVSALKRMIMAR